MLGSPIFRSIQPYIKHIIKDNCIRFDGTPKINFLKPAISTTLTMFPSGKKYLIYLKNQCHTIV